MIYKTYIFIIINMNKIFENQPSLFNDLFPLLKLLSLLKKVKEVFKAGHIKNV